MLSALSVPSIATSAISLATALFAFALGRTRALRHFRYFGLLAMSTCLYAASTALIVSTEDLGAVLTLVRLNAFTSAIHAAAWIHYSRGESGQPTTRADFGLSLAAIVGGLIGFVPGAVYTTPVVRLAVGWAGVTYPIPPPGPWAVVVYPLLLARGPRRRALSDLQPTHNARRAAVARARKREECAVSRRAARRARSPRRERGARDQQSACVCGGEHRLRARGDRCARN